MSDLSILWFKRDLRVADHPALAHASALGPVLPLYIVEPEYWALPDTSARQWAFVAECLAELRRDLAALGQPLIVRVGDAVTVLDRLRQSQGAARLISHEETGNLWTYARDRRVAAWARGAGIAWNELPQSGVVRRLRGRDGWAGQRDAFMHAAMEITPPALPPLSVAPGPIPNARSMGLATDRCPHRQIGGRGQGVALLGSFLTSRGEGYRAAMSGPVSGERACSRLSPFLALGALSVREVTQATAVRQTELRGQRDWAASMRSFHSRLAWRDHFMQKLEDQPSIETRCLHRAHEGLRPQPGDADLLHAWQTGATGMPFVDACMRYLTATGWLNFRMRAMLMSVASYHLWLDWRATAPHMARMFTDYEPGIHWSQCQMQSGTTGINTIRIYNPVKQGMDQDPAGAFIRAWVPELAGVPDGFVHMPWKWPGSQAVLGRTYPEPVVDVVQAGRAARDRVWALRKDAGFGEEAEQIAQRHASRKPAHGHGARPGAAGGRGGAKPLRRAAANPAQLRLDL
ncbi:FAD-binding domain-containing protein [Roseicitreum antarcticum]|uniref:Deoxyribodipyrimidine photo-lyase family protein (Cryptochrome) n=1 Tax=Roseicitreum antarcticum TaxID=564137 RepID=A0A1H2UAP0_9RHOB|nr:FAD-binding domain-containing protein [Roseicitreum antarcticum]SDW53231.1 deoxyribodipyrimidine photo-lyase family protein (cryptochrome) [Roseicitreum antarcticum]